LFLLSLNHWVIAHVVTGSFHDDDDDDDEEEEEEEEG
jgi:hypothetical protein